MPVDLFQRYVIGKLELRNRFVRSATWDATADVEGKVTGESIAIYKNLSKGGIGLIVTGYAFISRQGQSSPGQYGVYSDDMIPGLSRLAQVVHRGGGKIALQIVHGGFKSSFASSRTETVLAISKRGGDAPPQRQINDEDIEGIINDFAAAAQRAVEAGFDAVQLHGAHGLLMSQFLSPLFNTRTDKWGGNAENRRRFHLEVIHRIRHKVGLDFPLLIKFGVKDEQEGGLSLNEGIETAKQMAANGINAIEVSAGVGYTLAFRGSKVGIERTPFRERTAAVKHAVNVPIILVGGIRNLETAQQIVDSGDADLISMSRPFIREPGLINRWERDRRAALCISCDRCREKLSMGEPTECWQERNRE